VPAPHMMINRPDAYETATEPEMMQRLLPLAHARVLELGCGAAWLARQFAERYPDSRFTATEVDAIQHRKNIAQPAPPNLSFRLAGAQAIEEADESIDIVWMLKSLHHVPAALIPAAMGEITRVLKPGGLAYFCEPVYTGEFNALMSLIHDEKAVRELAFDAIRGLVERGAMQLQAEIFFHVPGRYESWERFEDRFLKVTHTELSIDEERYRTIRDAFLAHMGPEGADFLKPHRVDLLQKPV
jgi:ubiquinone/menaquinone biosynthesis C-methylase UbiE